MEIGAATEPGMARSSEILASPNEERQVREPASRLSVAGRSAACHFLTVSFLTLDEASAAWAPLAWTPTVKVVLVVLPEASLHAIFKV